MRILIVDDSGFTRRNLRRMLEQMGHLVEEAGDGPQALEKVSVQAPNLILLDLVMPGLTGFEVLDLLQQMRPDVPVIIATSDLQKTTADAVRSAGAKALLNKPFVREFLRTAVETALAGGNSWGD